MPETLGARPTPRLRPAAAGGLTFLAAGCVLVLEIAAARLLAPYVGVSLTTYTAIIGVILAGIAVGAWLGGRAADRLGAERLIGPALIAGGIAAMASVPVVAIVGEAGGDGPAGAVSLAALGFAAPAAILSSVAPMIVRASMIDVGSSGSLVGRLSAIGTAGALAGTFLTGFVLLGLVPTRVLIAGTGVLLAGVGAATALGLRRGGTPGPGALVLGLAVAGSLLFGAAAAAAPSPCQHESVYYCIAVRTDANSPGVRTLVLDRLLHASVDLADPTALRFRYVGWFAAAADPVVLANEAPLEALHVGGGGFTFPRYLRVVRPDSRHVVLELDPVVLETARRELGFTDDAAIEVRLGDARRTIGALDADAFDLVVGDAFGGLSVPWHLTTAEFVAEVDRVLRPEGRYVMNLIDTERLGFVRAEVATLRSRFAHVAVIAAGPALEGGPGGNVVLVASHAPLDLAAVGAAVTARDDGEVVIVGDPRQLDAFTQGWPVLTDDFAPVDQLIGR